MAAGRSDISVRMTPEGTQEVVNALNRVRNEASRTATAQNQAVAGINRITSSLQGLKSVIPAIGMAGLIVGFQRLVKQSVDLADSIGDISAATGASTKSLSVIAYTAKECGASFDTVEVALRKFTRTLADLRGGEKQATKIFGSLGLSAKDFSGMDSGQAFARVAAQMAQYEGSAEKAAVAQELFGRSGMDLIEILDKLGTEGFDQMAKKAAAAGAVVGDQTAAMAGEIKRSMGVIESQLTQAALQFTQGFAPAAQDAMGILSRQLSDGKSAMQSFGQYVGTVLKTIVIGFITSLYAIEVAWVRLKNRLVAIGATAGNVVKGGVAGAGVMVGTGLDFLVGWTGIDYFEDKVNALQEYRNQQDKNIENNWKMAKSEIAVGEAAAKRAYLERMGLTGIPEPTGTPGGGGSGGTRKMAPGVGGGGLKKQTDLRRAEMEFLRAQLEAENRMIDAQLSLREDREREAYESGRMSLQEYYDSRRRILEERQRHEADLIRAELEAVEGATAKDAEERIRNEAKAIQLRSELQVKELDYTRERIALEREELDAVRKLNEENSKRVATAADTQMQLSQENLRAQGRTREASLNELYLEIEALREKLTTEQGITAEAQRQLALKRQLGEAEINYQAQREQVQTAFNNLATQEAAIKFQVESGRMSEAQGEAQILTLRQQQIPILQQMVALLLTMAQLTGNMGFINEAMALSAQMGQLEASVARATLTMQTFKATAIDAANNALTQFFTSGIQNAKGFGDAMRQMALSVIQSLTAMIAQMLIALLFKRLLGGFSGGGFVGGGGGGADHMVRMAAGGVVTGPGTSTSDSVPAMLSAGEFVVNAAAVAQPGVLSHLVDINRGMYPTVRGGLPRFSDGGLAAPVPGPASFDSSLTVSLAPGLVASELDTPEGTRLIVKKLGENKRLVRQVLLGDR